MLYEVVLRQELFGQEIVNRWNYQSTGTPAAVTGSFGLAWAFGAVDTPFTSVIEKLQVLQATAVQFVDLEVRAVYDPLDFYTRPFATATTGSGIGEAASPVLAYGFRTNRVNRDIRRATKRIAGVLEEATAAGGGITGVYLTRADELRAAMSATLTYTDEGNNLTYAPCVVKKERYPVPGKDTFAYRYYEDPNVQLQNTALGVIWEVYDTVRTQASRQYGRGR